VGDSKRMAHQQDHTARINELDLLLRPDDGGAFDQIALVSDGRVAYAAWYSHLLSSLTLASAGEDLAFGHAEVIEERGIARIVVLTTSLVLTADLDLPAADVSNPFVSVVPRSVIESFKVRAGQGVDVEGSRKLAWPQSLVIFVKYRGLDEPLELRGAALEQNDPARVGPIWKLLGELRADITGSSPGA